MNWIKQLFSRRRLYGDLSAEIEEHLAEKVDELVAGGMSRQEATFAARREFGNVLQIEERSREVWQWPALENFLMDVRYGLRQLRKNPAFTAVAVLTLALGIGASSTVFSIVDQLFLRPWPVKDPARLAVVFTDSLYHGSSYPDYLDIRNEVSAFSDVVAYGWRGGVISGEGRGEDVAVQVVSQNYFAALGVKTALGRTFSPQPDQAAAEGHSVVVSYALWQRYFGGDPSLPSKTTLLDGKEFSVIGVTPQEFHGLSYGSFSGIWVTTEGWDTMVPGEKASYAERDYRWFDLAGRLRPGVQLPEARAQLQTLAKRLALAFPATNKDVNFLAYPASKVRHEGISLGFYLMAMVGMVLLISCANVANLLLAQAERRQREIAMRLALGAGRRRLFGQLLTEGLLLALAGGGLGVLLASWLMKVVPTIVSLPFTTDLTLDGRVLLFSVAVSLLTAVIFGLAPGLHAAKCDLVLVLKGDDPYWGRAAGRLPLRSMLVCGEIALCVVLLVGSGLLLRSLFYSQGINPGFDTKRNVLMLTVAPPTLYGYNQTQAAALYPALAARVESVPGVVRASYARRPPLPLGGMEGGETQAVIIPGVEPLPGSEHFSIRYNIVAPEFFQTIGAHIIKGREFNAFDTPSNAPVVIVNDAMARRFWPDQNPVGKSIQVGKKNCQIVGVVEAGRYVHLHESVQPYLFLPFTQNFSFECVLLVETAGDPRAFVRTILKETAAVDKHLPIVSAVTLRDYMRSILDVERSMAGLLTSLSILGMFLAAGGLYATVAYLVNRRTHEIGIRMALGARRPDVLRLVMAQGLRLSAAGAGIGLPAAIVVSRLTSNFLYGVKPTDPLCYAASILVAVGVALLASYFPARRATKVDPMVALRYE
ncbi:MAG: ABC transporter permease [Terriglobia bacterium]